MSTVQDRVREFIEYLGISARKFEMKCGLSNGFVCNLGPVMTEKAMTKILSAYPKLNRAWLVLGEGEMLLNSEQMARRGIKDNASIAPSQEPLLDALRDIIASKSSVITLLQEKVDAYDLRIEEYKKKIDALNEELAKYKAASVENNSK